MDHKKVLIMHPLEVYQMHITESSITDLQNTEHGKKLKHLLQFLMGVNQLLTSFLNEKTNANFMIIIVKMI